MRLAIGNQLQTMNKFILILGLTLPSLGLTSELYTDEQCLTANVFFEARGESLKGMRAIADVTINRTKHSAFPENEGICAVVFQPYQFSWVYGDSKRSKKVLLGDLKGFKAEDKASYQKAKQLAVEALSEGYKPLLPSWVVSFHNTTVNPDWAGKMRYYATIGGHKFYGFKRKSL